MHPLARIENLPAEILCQILESTRAEEKTSRDSDSLCNDLTNRICHLPSGLLSLGIEHPLLKSSVCLHKSLERYLLSTTTFIYSSGAFGSVLHTGSKAKFDTAAHDLLKWLSCLSHSQRKMVRKFRLEMHASELLWLFMPVEAGQRLRISHDRKVWGEAFALLKEMHLTEFNITVLGRSCPRPCTAGEKTATGFHPTDANDDGSVSSHWEVDWRWIVKAVMSSFQSNVSKGGVTFAVSNSEDRDTEREHPSTIEPGKVQQLVALSWNALESSTIGWHTCDTLAYDGQRERSWAREGEQEPRTYRTPIRRSRDAWKGHGVDEHIDTSGLV